MSVQVTWYMLSCACMLLQTYNPRSSLTTATFWKNGVLMAAIDAAICFFLPYYSLRANGQKCGPLLCFLSLFKACQDLHTC